MLEKLAAEDPKNLVVRRRLGLSYSRAAEILQAVPGDRPQAMALYEKAIVAKQALVAQEPENAEFRRLVAYDQFNVAQLLFDMGNDDGALAHDRAALEAFQKMAGRDPANAQFRQDIGEVSGHMGRVLLQKGDPAAAIAQLRRSLSVLTALEGSREPTSWVGQTIAGDQYWLGKAHVQIAAKAQSSPGLRAAQCREAQDWLHQALPSFEALRDHGPPNYGGAQRVAEVQRQLALCRDLTQRP
jgi:tetratricopeptide (TPR) repeat protein